MSDLSPPLPPQAGAVGHVQPRPESPQEAMLRFVVEEDAARTRIARQLHNGMGQTLVAVRMLLVRLYGKDPGVHAQVGRLLDELSVDLHHVCMELRPLALDELGLARMLPALLTDWSERTSIAVTSTISESEERPPKAVETILHRILLDSLNDIAASPGVRNVAVSLEHNGPELTLSVQHDGTSDSGPTQPERWLAPNLSRIRLLAGLLDGSVSVGWAPERGTQLSVRVPIRDSPSAAPKG